MKKDNEIVHISRERDSTLIHVQSSGQHGDGTLIHVQPDGGKPPRKKRLWLVLLLAAVIIAAAVLIVYQQHDGGSGTPPVKTSTSPTVKPADSQTPGQTAAPTAAPTAKPTAAPTAKPTAAPTAKPTAAPTAKPTAAPTAKPTAKPTPAPTAKPTPKPQGTAPTGYSMSLSSSRVYLYEQFTVLVQPYESDYTRIVVHAIDPKGARWDFTLTGRNSTSLYVDQPDLVGTWTIYCDVTNNYGTYYGGSSGPYATVYVEAGYF